MDETICVFSGKLKLGLLGEQSFIYRNPSYGIKDYNYFEYIWCLPFSKFINMSESISVFSG